MRIQIASVFVLAAALVPAVAKASTVVMAGPITFTFSGTDPLKFNDPYVDSGPNSGYVIYDLQDLEIIGSGTIANVDQITQFGVSVASGWQITGVTFFPGDFYFAQDGGENGSSSVSSYKVSQKFTLCDAVGCHSDGDANYGGQRPLADPVFTASTGSMQGTYELSAHVAYGDYSTDSQNPYVRVDYGVYTPTVSTTPEPASLMLTGTGLTALLGTVRLRRRKR